VATLTIILFAASPVSNLFFGTFPFADFSCQLEHKLFHLPVSYKARFLSYPYPIMLPLKFLYPPKDVSPKLFLHILSISKPLHFSAVRYSNSLLLILNNRYYLTIGAGIEPSGGIFKMSKTRNKSTTDFPSGGSGSGGSHFRDRSEGRIQIEVGTVGATDSETLHGDSFNNSTSYRKI
jgi:hypothetical protein